MEITVEKLIDKYNEHRKLVEENTKNIESIQMDLDEVEEAIEAIEEFGGLLDFIKVLEESKKKEKLIEKLQKSNKKIQAIYSEYNDIPDYISDRNTSKNIKELDEIIEFGKNIKELMEENKVTDLNSKEEVLKVLYKYRDEFNEEIKKSQEQIDASMSLIDNIKKVSEEKIIDVTNDDKTRKQEIEFGIKEIEPLIGEMQNLEMELSKYAFFRAEGILTHTQTLQINSIINRQKVLTGEFSRKMGFNQEGAPAFAVIDSMTMANMYYARKKDLEQAERTIDAPVQTQKLSNLVKDVDATLNKFNKDAEAEKEEKLTFKNLVIYGNAISKIENNDFVFAQPTFENNSVIITPVVVTVETSQEKPKEESITATPVVETAEPSHKKVKVTPVKKEEHRFIEPKINEEKPKEEIEQPSSLENEEVPSFSFILDEPKPSIYDDIEVEPKKKEDSDKPVEADPISNERERFYEYDPSPAEEIPTSVEETTTNERERFYEYDPSPAEEIPTSVEETTTNERERFYGYDPSPVEEIPTQVEEELTTEEPKTETFRFFPPTEPEEEIEATTEENSVMPEYVDKGEDFEQAIDNREVESNLNMAEANKQIAELFNNVFSQQVQEQPKKENKVKNFFSSISKKIKRKVTKSQYLKNRAEVCQILEAEQNMFESEMEAPEDRREHTL